MTDLIKGKIHLNINFVPRNSFENFELVALDVQAEEVDLRLSDSQQNGVKGETLNSYQIRIDARYSRFLQCFGFTFDVTMAWIAAFGLKSYLKKKTSSSNLHHEHVKFDKTGKLAASYILE
jgi:hypothetical protein